MFGSGSDATEPQGVSRFQTEVFITSNEFLILSDLVFEVQNLPYMAFREVGAIPLRILLFTMRAKTTGFLVVSLVATGTNSGRVRAQSVRCKLCKSLSHVASQSFVRF